MAEMSSYCKAYEARKLAAYPHWQPDLDNLEQPEAEEPDHEPERRTELEDDDVLYLHEDFIVTDGIFRDEHVIFDKVTDLWKEACNTQLGFEIPVYEPVQAAAAAGSGATED